MKMAFKDFTAGDLVWAKMKCYPPWPAKIESPPEDIKAPKTKDCQYVFFFGSENYAWIPDIYITPHSDSVLKTFGNKKSAPFQKAVDELMSYAKDPKKGRPSPAKAKSDKIETDGVVRTKVVKVAAKNIVKKYERKVASANKSPIKVSKKRSIKDVNGSFDVDFPSKLSKSLVRNTSARVQDALKRSSLQKLNGESPMDAKQVQASPRKIGFIGLGQMGRSIVRNMIETGHDVTVYNRHSYKYSAFQRAKKAESPADLVMKCDITFCCVSDPEASKKLIFGDQGILKGLGQAEKSNVSQPRKAYVEMTSMDVRSSMEISEAIGMKQGLYLEANLCGTNKDAEDGTLLIIASGDRRVFTNSESCFHAIGRHAFYLSCEVGYSAKISLVLGMLAGTLCAVLAEIMVMAEKLKVPREHFLKLLRLSLLHRNSLMHKMDLLRRRSFSMFTSVENDRKGVILSLMAAENFSQPMPITAAVNELFKLSKTKGYSEKDTGALYKSLHVDYIHSP